MSDLYELYQSLILDHNRRPRNCGTVADADCHADGYNPLCGDRITVTMRLDGDRITEIAFEGTGCAISTASASLMTDSLKGKTVEEAKALFAKFHGLLTENATVDSQGPELGKLKVFSGVCQFPARVKCATLAWHTLSAALENRVGVVSTE